jgi:nucleoside triphosphatase
MRKQIYPEPTVGALIFNRKRKVLLLRSERWGGKYVVPGGHIELGEQIQEAVIREVKEETGLDVYDLEFVMMQECVYDKEFFRKMHFIFFDYLCTTDANEDDVKMNHEAQAYIWVTLDKALGMSLDPYTRRLIEKVKRPQTPLFRGNHGT